MNIEPVKKTNKSGDKRQQQGKKKQQRKFLNNFRKTLDKYRFGGILADDMGLGK